MTRWMASFILVIVSFSMTAAERYYLSVCAIFQNEAPYLKEWIEYHRLMGVDHFYLYNNCSNDHFQMVLDPYLKQGIAELKDWPSADLCPEQTFQKWRMYQPSSYNDCINNCSTHWLAIIDIDEFLVPIKHPDLVSFLSQFDPSVGGIAVNWVNYGTSNLPEIPEGKLMIESLLWRAHSEYITNTVVKSIVRPSAIEKMFIHHADYREGYSVWPEASVERLKRLQIEDIRINHYFTRAEDFFYTVKGDRLMKKNPQKCRQIMKEKAVELNRVYDPILLKVVPQLKEALNSSN